MKFFIGLKMKYWNFIGTIFFLTLIAIIRCFKSLISMIFWKIKLTMLVQIKTIQLFYLISFINIWIQNILHYSVCNWGCWSMNFISEGWLKMYTSTYVCNTIENQWGWTWVIFIPTIFCWTANYHLISHTPGLWFHTHIYIHKWYMKIRKMLYKKNINEHKSKLDEVKNQMTIQ